MTGDGTLNTSPHVKTLILILILIPIMTSTSSSQMPSSKELASEIFEQYETFSLKQITTRRFKQSEMLEWLKSFEVKKVIEKIPAGQSAEGRTVSLLKYGKGTTIVLLWSQMHGDEATATMALLDMLNFFASAPSHHAVRVISERLTLLIIPMLNPDGAERHQRRTAQMIDMNRDALSLGTPEARILKNVHEQYKPTFAFNLHDQDPRYTVGTTRKVVALSLLAPAADEAKSDSPNRMRAKRVASLFAEMMEMFIPGHVARYDDTFEPRAFGDNIQKWGSSTILVESGGWPNDREKFFLRKLNFVGLTTVLYAIAIGETENADTSAYEHLPFNTKGMFDLIVRNVLFKAGDSVPPLRVDVAVNYEEEMSDTLGLQLFGRVVDLGDLSTFVAFEDLDGSSMTWDISQIKLDRRFTSVELRALLYK